MRFVELAALRSKDLLPLFRCAPFSGTGDRRCTFRPSSQRMSCQCHGPMQAGMHFAAEIVHARPPRAEWRDFERQTESKLGDAKLRVVVACRCKDRRATGAKMPDSATNQRPEGDEERRARRGKKKYLQTNAIVAICVLIKMRRQRETLLSISRCECDGRWSEDVCCSPGGGRPFASLVARSPSSVRPLRLEWDAICVHCERGPNQRDGGSGNVLIMTSFLSLPRPPLKRIEIWQLGCVFVFVFGVHSCRLGRALDERRTLQ